MKELIQHVQIIQKQLYFSKFFNKIKFYYFNILSMEECLKDDSFECDSNFGMEFDMDFSSESLSIAQKTLHDSKSTLTNSNDTLSMISQEKLNSTANQLNIKEELPTDDRLRLYANNDDDWIFSAIHDFPPSKTKPLGLDYYNKKQNNKSHKEKNDNNDYLHPKKRAIDIWTINHKSIGKKVLRYFNINNTLTEYIGIVVAYMPANPGWNDQLYHINYPEDDDSEDLEEAEYTEARTKFKFTYIEK